MIRAAEIALAGPAPMLQDNSARFGAVKADFVFSAYLCYDGDLSRLI
jgi:hypothetical protein